MTINQKTKLDWKAILKRMKWPAVILLSVVVLTVFGILVPNTAQTQIIEFLKVVTWPLLALFVLLYLGKDFKSYLDELRKDKNVSEVSAEMGTAGVKLSVKRQVEAATNLALAVNRRQSPETPNAEQAPSEAKTQEVLNVVSKTAISQTVQQVAGAKVLWVDDHPSNNYYERSALEALGIQFTQSTSTEDALEKIAINKYVAILSDMGRHPDSQAGYTLLEKLRTEELYKRNVDTPFIIYGRSNLPADKAETKRRGGFGMTNNPQELFQLVIKAINTIQNG